MKNLSKLVLLFTSIFLTQGCEKETFGINEEILLEFNDAAFLSIDGGEYEISFTKLKEESRCPPDVYCFWAGQVAVNIKINGDDYVLGHHIDIPSTVAFENRVFRLLAVEYNKDRNFGKERHASIKLRVE